MPAMPSSRRQFIQMGGAAASLAFAARCASRLPAYVVEPASPSRPAPRRLERVNVSEDRIIRRVVGLRPFRPAGFVVRAESLDGKLLVHNYGHGGGGVTLSWGTATLAADLVRESGRSGGSAAVLGCGVIGLSTARILQDRGFDVTIHARRLPPDTTSNVAGAMWQPSYVFDRPKLTAEFDAQFQTAMKISQRTFQSLVGADYAVRWRDLFVLSTDPSSNGVSDWGLPELYPNRHALSAAENPFASPRVVVEDTLFIEPFAYLRALIRDFHLAGGRIVVRELASASEVAALTEPVVVNATGLGARELFGDRELVAIKGQLTVLLPQPGVDYAVATEDLYMFPRSDGILLGGTHERGVETLEPDLEAEKRILAGQRAIFEGMRTE
jgi:glycine/D-amino acid oxidase-like deaminating enzyme